MPSIAVVEETRSVEVFSLDVVHEKYRNGGTNVVASKLQAYIDRVNS